MLILLIKKLKVKLLFNPLFILTSSIIYNILFIFTLYTTTSMTGFPNLFQVIVPTFNLSIATFIHRQNDLVMLPIFTQNIHNPKNMGPQYPIGVMYPGFGNHCSMWLFRSQNNIFDDQIYLVNCKY